MFISPYVTQRFIMWTFCLLQYVTFQLITETPRVKNVTQAHFDPALWPSCTSHHAVLSSYSFSMPTPASCVLLPSDLMTTPSLVHLTPPPLQYFFFPPSVLPTSSSNRCILSLPLCLSFFIIFSSFHLSPFSIINTPTHPFFFCQSAVTGFVWVGLAVSMSSHSQQW